MAIVISNDGDITVASIVERNATINRFNGMTVTVTDATGDVELGSGTAQYEWVVVGARWSLVWADALGIVTTLNTSDIIDNVITTDSALPLSANQGKLLKDQVDGKVDDGQVLTDVPAGALFTDTVYTHPANHAPSIITQDASNRFVTDTEKSTWNDKASTTSPSLTGVPLAPTAVNGTNTTQIATTAYVLSNAGTMPANDILTSLKTVDGTGSGLDADLLDGYQATTLPVSTAQQTALNGKVDDGQVLTNVPAGAVFTDTAYPSDSLIAQDITDIGNLSGTNTGDQTTVSGSSGSFTGNLAGDVTGTQGATVVGNDSHTHAFNNLTGKAGGTGDYMTSGNLVSGNGSGGVALTINDGYGNANITFNHEKGVPEQTGNAARIEVNTDGLSATTMVFHAGQGTAGVAADLPTVLTLGETTSTFAGTVAAPTFSGSLAGNADTSTWADTVDVNGNNASINWYDVAWHSGDTLYSSTGVEIQGSTNSLRASKLLATDSVDIGSTQQASIKYNATENSIDFIIN
jgi:hypothetical protein